MSAPPNYVGKPLTEKQKAVWELKQQGKTLPEIAAALGLSISNVEKHSRYVRSKLGLTKPAVKQAPKDISGNAVHEINEKMIEVGLPTRVRLAHVRRLKVKHEGEETPLKPITDEELKDSHRKALYLIHSYMDDKVVAEASLRDLATASAQLTEKLQLLEGKPTQIVSDLERKKLHELLPLLIEEGKRRGLTIDGTVTEKVVSPA